MTNWCAQHFDPLFLKLYRVYKPRTHRPKRRTAFHWEIKSYPYAINGHHCGIAVLVCQTLQDVGDAFASCFRGQGVLEGSCGLLGLLRNLSGNRPCHQPSEDVAHDDPSDPTVGLPQSCDLAQPQPLQNLSWHASDCQNGCNSGQLFGIGLALQNGSSPSCSAEAQQ